MPDPGFISGFIGVGIDMLITYILDQINVARRCKTELNSLRHLVQRIQPIIVQIQKDRLALNWKKGIRNEAPAVNEWLKKLEDLLLQASTMAHDCTVPRFDIISHYKTSKRIAALISEINQHLDPATLVVWASMLEGLGQIKEIIESSASSSASTSATTSQPLIPSTGFFIKEPLIVGQEIALSRLEKLVIDEAANSPFSRIGVFGKGGSGKTLLLKTLFNRKEVRNFFRDGLFLWLTVSQFPSITSLLKELSAQIAMHTKEDSDKNMSEEAVQIWLNERMEGKRFILILDDVWKKGGELLEQLGLLRLIDPSNSKVIVSSRHRRALLGMGVPDKSVIAIGDLDKDDSWRLFVYHAFPYNNGNPPTNIDHGAAKAVCAKCGGLPLAIKAVGRAMAEITDPHEWELAVDRLPIGDREDEEAVYHRLRLSYDALGSYGVNLQMCFLYLAAFIEDEIIWDDEAIPLWTGEGLIAKYKLEGQCGHGPFEIGKIYINFLADRCLIEPIGRDVDGQVYAFRMHDVLRELAKKIAEEEEGFFCRAGRGLTKLEKDEENECFGRVRILLNNNKLRSLPESLSARKVCSLTVRENNNIEIPGRLIKGMFSLKILDLSLTSLQSLPESVGSLKQLVFLNLAFVPIRTLPATFTNLVNLQILKLCRSGITKLPSDIHNLKSLKYLSLFQCEALKCLPYSISRLACLQYLNLDGCSNMWKTHQPEHRWKRVASVNDLGRLRQLRSLSLENNGQTINKGTLGNLTDVETLKLTLTGMASLPCDIISLSKLRRLWLVCPEVSKMEINFCEFQFLSHLKLSSCSMLEEIPQLHKLKGLKQLDIADCHNLENLPKEFGEGGAFPAMEIFSLVHLSELKKLPVIEKDAMSSLKIFTIMKCQALKTMPESYLNLKALQKVRVYGCPMLSKNLDEFKTTITEVQIVTTALVDIAYAEYFRRAHQTTSTESWTLYDGYWSNEVSLFLAELYRLF